MVYMEREPEKRLNPNLPFPAAKSVITLGVSYYQGAFPEKPGRAYGRVARYAWGLDYHDIIAARLETLMARYREILGADSVVTTALDTKPVLERALAHKSQLGFIGKNTVLIIPNNGRYHVGSWVFLTEVFVTVPLEEKGLVPRSSPKANEGGCGSCTKCVTACPTDAFEAPYRLNARKCISYLTIENKGGIPIDMRASVGDWLFGCDVCQDVCPFNARAAEARWPELSSEKGAGAWLSLKDLFSLSTPAAFKARFAGTPLLRSKRRGLLRNACVVAGNSGDESLAVDLVNLLSDPEPLLRGHALWALSKLNPRDAKSRADNLRKTDADAGVLEECNAVLGQN